MRENEIEGARLRAAQRAIDPEAWDRAREARRRFEGDVVDRERAAIAGQDAPPHPRIGPNRLRYLAAWKSWSEQRPDTVDPAELDRWRAAEPAQPAPDEREATPAEIADHIGVRRQMSQADVSRAVEAAGAEAASAAEAEAAEEAAMAAELAAARAEDTAEESARTARAEAAGAEASEGK